MNNYIIIIIIIILIFIFSGDKNLINQLITNKLLIILLVLYLLYNNFNLIFLLLILIIVILSNENIRNIIYNRYDKYIDIYKNMIKKFLDIKDISDSSKQNQDSNIHSKLLKTIIDNENIDNENIDNEIINDTIEQNSNEEIEKLINEIEI